MVRARCDEGWTFTEALLKESGGSVCDLEVVVESSPGPSGYLVRRSDGTELSLVFESSVAIALNRLLSAVTAFACWGFFSGLPRSLS